MSERELTRREELLADGALAWLEGPEEAAFGALLHDDAAGAEFAGLERTAAVASFALAEPDAQHGDADLVRLTARLQADALAFFAGQAATARGAPRAAARSTAGMHVRQALPWLLAAASLVLLLWPDRWHAEEPPPAVARAALLESASGLVQCAWQPGPGAGSGEVSGDVVWDAERQQGFLRLRGLPPLDPAHRYQLWIVDAARQGPPVDGGLLTLPAAAGEVVVRVASRLPVRRAAAFVLTVETADGVVVSAQEQVVAIARP